MANLNKIIDELSKLTVVEAADLSKQLEEKWGVKAATAVAAAPAAGSAAPAEEKTDFTIFLTAAGDKKINVIKEVRAITGLGFTTYPSIGNFVLVDVEQDPATVYDRLLHRGVIARPMGPWGLPTHLRLSVGTPLQTKRAISALIEVLSL